MTRYTDLYHRWERIAQTIDNANVTILGVEYTIDLVGKDGDMVSLKLDPVGQIGSCYLLVSYDEFEKLLDSIGVKPMGKVAKIKFLLNTLTRDFPNALQSRIVKGTLQPILVSCDVDLPEEYPDGTIVTKDEVEKAVNLFRARLRRI